ncbi:hypothetical protein DA792_01705 (plasmid) [Celeribacter baekdonensis]|uniref:Uncharacterized protein n=1 Tax=Celeribacter baekdonensis TaxID=875171 RepID=A0A2R4LYB4_9RHOB|nr:hypothetical protein DA792_01705 [Celeribacter baekdonensis]
MFPSSVGPKSKVFGVALTYGEAFELFPRLGSRVPKRCSRWRSQSGRVCHADHQIFGYLWSAGAAVFANVRTDRQCQRLFAILLTCPPDITCRFSPRDPDYGIVRSNMTTFCVEK